MKLLFITHSYYPAFKHGGPVVSVHSINKKLVEMGVEVTVLTTNAGLEKDKSIQVNDWILQDGVRVKYFNYYGNRLYNISPALAFETAKIIKEYDIVHSTPVWNFPNLIAGYLCILFNKPYVISPRGTLYKETIDLKSTFLKKIYYCLFVKYLLNKASLIHFTTNDEKEKVIEYLGLNNNAVVIPNGLDMDDFSILPNKGLFRKRYNINENDLIVLFLGRINIKKGLDLLIKAFMKLTKEIKDIKLIIAGFDNEGYSEKLKQLITGLHIQEHVIFTGPLLNEFKKEAFIDADVFVLPSHSENFGMAVVEAMASGCPVVLSNKVGIHNVISENNIGVVTEASINSLVLGLRKIILDTGYQKMLSDSGRDYVNKYFNINSVAIEVISEYERLLN